MAGGDEMIGLNGAAGIGAALLFIGAGTNVYDAFSAVMSSPWSTEKFTQSPEEEAMARRYIKHAMCISWIYAGVGSVLAYKSAGWRLAVWPMVGAGIVTAYMYWLYNGAVARSPNQGGPAPTVDGASALNGNGNSPRPAGSYPWTA